MDLLKTSQNSQGNTCVRRNFTAATLFKKETPKHVFYCEFCEIFKNTYLDENLRTAASVFYCYSWINNFKRLV